MRIVTQSTFGPPSVLEVVEVEDPRPGVDEVLVDVAAAGVNPVDIAVRSGNFPFSVTRRTRSAETSPARWPRSVMVSRR
ncbi:MAG: hypothetical protein WKF58_09710 [Ilumatobacteraceae bacterium]